MSKYPGLACLTLALLLSISTGVTDAAEGQGVWRTFAVLLNYGTSVDFSDEDSVLIKVEKADVTPSAKEFAGFGEDLDGTVAVIGFPGAMYITKTNGRTYIGSFWWLLSEETPEPPPIGAVALTGADAQLYQQSLGSINVSGAHILPDTSGAGKQMILVTARFSK